MLGGGGVVAWARKTGWMTRQRAPTNRFIKLALKSGLTACFYLTNHGIYYHHQQLKYKSKVQIMPSSLSMILGVLIHFATQFVTLLHLFQYANTQNLIGNQYLINYL